MNSRLLHISGLTCGYGGRPVLSDLSLELLTGQAVALIGPNGCGKSTLLRTIVAEIVETAGVIEFRGEDISKLETDAVIRKGIGYLRQTRNVFPGLTVAENLELAVACAPDKAQLDEVLRHFPSLQERPDTRAGLLSGGQRQMLAVSMALARPVSLLLLDEPLAGLSQAVACELLDAIRSLRADAQFAMIIVEHRLRLIRPHVQRVVVMARGSVGEDTTDVSILEDRARLERHYML